MLNLFREIFKDLIICQLTILGIYVVRPGKKISVPFFLIDLKKEDVGNYNIQAESKNFYTWDAALLRLVRVPFSEDLRFKGPHFETQPFQVFTR